MNTFTTALLTALFALAVLFAWLASAPRQPIAPGAVPAPALTRGTDVAGAEALAAARARCDAELAQTRTDRDDARQALSAARAEAEAASKAVQDLTTRLREAEKDRQAAEAGLSQAQTELTHLRAKLEDATQELTVLRLQREAETRSKP